MTYYDIRPNMEQVRYCRDNIEKLVLRKSGEFTGEHNHWLFGMIAETMVCDLLDQERPLVRNESDLGSDVTINGLRVDVKVTIRNRPAQIRRDHAVVNALQRNNECDAYLFMSYNRKNGKYRVIGWISKEDWLEKHSFIARGNMLPKETDTLHEAQVDTMVLSYNELNRIRSYQDLKQVGAKQ